MGSAPRSHKPLLLLRSYAYMSIFSNCFNSHVPMTQSDNIINYIAFISLSDHSKLFTLNYFIRGKKITSFIDSFPVNIIVNLSIPRP